MLKILVFLLYMINVIVAIIVPIIVILKAKLHYLKIISELPSYGAKCFSTTLNSVSSSSPPSSCARVWSVIHFPHFPIFLWNPFFSFFLLNLSWITVSAWIRTFPQNFWFFWQRHHHHHPHFTRYKNWNSQDSNVETVILVSPKFGISQINSLRNTVVSTNEKHYNITNRSLKICKQSPELGKTD